MSIKNIQIGQTQILVEISELSLKEEIPNSTLYEIDGLEATGVGNKIVDVADQLNNIIRSMAVTIKDSLKEAAPDEWSIEFTVGFKGEAGVPFITKGEANASLKVNAKWKHA